MPRKQERTPVSIDIILEWSSGKRQARISDLSLQGCFIDCLASIREGEIVSFKVNLSEKEWFDLRGKVVYALDGFGFGVHFIELPKNVLSLVEHCILINNGNPWGQDEAAAADQLPAGNLSATGRVLVSDDDPIVRKLAAEILQKDGFTVVCVENAREAYYCLLAESDFAAAIFDAESPELMAFNVVRFMKMEQRLQNIPIGIMTDAKDAKIEQHCFAAGAGMFLPKPFTSHEFSQKLKSLLARNGV